MSDDSVPVPQPVFVISDGTGETAEKVTRAALRQFRNHVVLVRVYSHVTTPEQLGARMRSALRKEAMVVTTLVDKDMRKLAVKLAKDLGVRHHDALGPLLVQLEGFLDERARGVPGLLREVDEDYFRRIEAVEFTVKCDDGKEPRMLSRADIVLVGVSRTSKTPLSTYLAHKGYKVGNVPLVLDRPPPGELFQVDQNRVIALTIAPSALQNIRLTRLRAMGMPDSTNYSDIDYILAELEYAQDLYRGNPQWPVVDVTNRAVEETAATIFRVFQDRGIGHPADDDSAL